MTDARHKRETSGLLGLRARNARGYGTWATQLATRAATRLSVDAADAAVEADVAACGARG